MDAPHAERVVREAFVLAAVESARMFAGRATQSRVASIAGISRLDVRKILSGRHSKSARNSKHHATRIERLLEGWRSDPLFLDRRGRPKALSFKGASSDFGLLVRKYGRDVTARALLEQMMRSRIIRNREGKILLESGRPNSAAGPAAAVIDLRFLAARLEDFKWIEGRRTFSIAQVEIPVGEKKAANLVRRIALERLQTVLGSLGALKLETTTLDRRARKKNRVLVTASIVSDVEEGKQ
jgi:hypothetical protein